MAARTRARASAPHTRPARALARPAKKVAFALVAASPRLESAENSRVALALQKQLIHDFEPAWNVSASITAFAHLNDVPVGHWPLVVKDRLEFEVLAFHTVKNGQPYGEIASGTGWSKSASHTLLEMLIDPRGDRLTPGPSPVPGQRYDVDYLVQICDPCMAAEYRIDDVPVSDFSLPAFWEPSRAAGGKYSETGLLRKSFEVAQGGYISWRDPRNNHWYQKAWFGERAEVHDLGTYDGGDEPRTSSSKRRGRARSTQTRTIRFQLTSLIDVYRVQEPQLGSARAAVESLIQRFG